ncbi:DUF3575 domain-containing protein [Chryseobacterium sp.]|uniref:DUF3575 domain-containing protein n=1 Tax=Chryseobacterium sp. TaxID=1871047 RepID=UPI001B07D9A7|nr:DUF3575 domain-containing protein [Chryseobacterium sp.]MBO9692941.1 DUF3575 domain-containing protein [Chryseobacterium sp.]
MKKTFFFGAMALCASANGQNNSFKADPVSIIAGGGTNLLSYERVISKHSTAGVGAGYATFKIEDYKFNYLGGNIFYRYYFREALRGFYLTGATGFGGGRSKYTANNKNLKDTYTMIDITARLGYQWVWKSGLTLDLNLGGHYAKVFYKEDKFKKNSLKAEESELFPNIGVALGYSF